jgi:hypothetical protein
VRSGPDLTRVESLVVYRPEGEPALREGRDREGVAHRRDVTMRRLAENSAAEPEHRSARRALSLL